jgi:hypothetical protein
MISTRTAQLIKQLNETGIAEEVAEILRTRYYDDWNLSSTSEEREILFLKTQMIDELLNEFSTILDFNRETENANPSSS